MRDRKPRIRTVFYAPNDQEPRSIGQIAEFRRDYHVWTAGFGPEPSGVDDHNELERLP